jgi:F-type H+-transporting ATPase subunit b
VDILALPGSVAEVAVQLTTEAGGEAAPGFQINIFWVITQAASFVLFLVILYLAAFRRIGGVLEERRSKIEQGLKDADAARKEREQAAAERQRVLTDARKEAAELVARGQRLAEEVRERDLARAREEVERVRQQAASEIEAERQRALTDVRSQVADLALAAAAKVVGETMDDKRQRRLVEEFLAEAGAGNGRGRG